MSLEKTQHSVVNRRIPASPSCVVFTKQKVLSIIFVLFWMERTQLLVEFDVSQRMLCFFSDVSMCTVFCKPMTVY